MKSGTESQTSRGVVLYCLHIVLAAFLLLMAFLMHGRVPGLSADETAVLGFLLFFGLGLPALLISVATLVLSLVTGGRWLVRLSAALVLGTILVMMSVWTGVVASLTYLSLAVWALVDRLRRATPVR